jgi:DNA-binding PadR family transcriptional regulator
MAIERAKRRAHTEALPDEAAVTPAIFHIMLVLAEGAAHGYAIMGDIERLTDGRMRLGPGTLYRSLQRMEVEGLVEEVGLQREDAPDDERRRYYRLTRAGRRVAHAEAERLASLVRLARGRGLLRGRGRA